MRSLCVIVGCHMTGGCAWFVTTWLGILNLHNDNAADLVSIQCSTSLLDTQQGLLDHSNSVWMGCLEIPVPSALLILTFDIINSPISPSL